MRRCRIEGRVHRVGRCGPGRGGNGRLGLGPGRRSSPSAAAGAAPEGCGGADGDGREERGGEREGAGTNAGPVASPPTARARTWLLNRGWRHHGLIPVDAVPVAASTRRTAAPARPTCFGTNVA